MTVSEFIKIWFREAYLRRQGDIVILVHIAMLLLSLAALVLWLLGKPIPANILPMSLGWHFGTLAASFNYTWKLKNYRKQQFWNKLK